MRENRVVITGIGVVAPNALGVSDFNQALQEGRSGIQFWEELKRLNFRCQIGGKPPLTDEYIDSLLPEFFSKKLSNKAIIYACLSGIEAWKDAGLPVQSEERDPDSGIVFGAGDLGFDSLREPHEYYAYYVDRGEPRKLGSRTISEAMNSGAAAYLNSLLGLGNRVTSNSSACTTGSESVFLGYEHIKAGKAKRMICGSTEGDGRYIWGAFDAMRVLCADSNDNPTYGSRPMSDSSAGFVPGGGSGALVLESLESAQARGAKIYAEILGGELNSGGQRNGGSMTAPNPEAVIGCIKSAVETSEINPSEIDLISGHLTSTKGDPLEIQNWLTALDLKPESFPPVNTVKSMIGHCIGGVGSIELVSCILQMNHNYIHSNQNVEHIHPEIEKLIPLTKIPKETIYQPINTVIKANFGFGDINCCLVLRKYNN
ncbi:MAG: beta-ketoacyl-[acyl-carrier-protein] synthase family protein [Bacteroidota bacterium]